MMPFDIDLGDHEITRLSAVMDAIDLDPEALEDEQRAETLLYSGLDAEQQRIYDMLVAAGVLPDG